MSTSTSSTLARWTDEEHQILVQLTNDQIELESQDHTQEISWAEHWRQVSSKLHESGYTRTNTACQSYWKRVVETQKANEEAAGPRWDDSEHRILLGMTEDQLALEREDPAAVIPWPKHWKKVSIRLQENGYNRTPNACSAYWLTVGYDFSVDNFEPVPGMLKMRKIDDAKDEVDEEVVVEVTAEPGENNQANGDDSVSTSSRDDEILPGGLPEPKTILLSNATSIFTPSITPAPSEKDPSEDESHQARQREPTKSKVSQTPATAEVTPPRPRSPKLPMRRGFRFSAEQRAVLEAQVANHGPYPDTDRRIELARDFGVEEKTIRNWFIHRRSQKGQSIVSGMTTPGQNNYEESFVSEGSTPASAPPDSGAKRRPIAVDCNDHSLSVGEDIGVHHVKRPRLGNEHDHSYHEEPRMNTNTIPSHNPLEDFGTERGFGMRQSSGSSISVDPSRNSSLAGSSIGRESAATSMASFSPVNMTTTARHHPTGDLPVQTLRNERQDEHRPEIKKSPSFPTPVSGADWNPINSARGRESRPVSLASATSTPTPTPHTLPSYHGHHLSSQHPYGKPVSAAPPPPPPPPPPAPLNANHRPFQQHPVSASPPPPKPSSSPNDSDEKQWMSSKVCSFQTEIESLNRDRATRLQRISQIDDRIDQMTNEENALDEEKEKEILEAVRKIEERYRGRHEYVKRQQRELGQSRDVELEGLQRNGLDLKKRRTALEHFQALVGLYDEE
ncbi:hypothetical protein BKA64DRAFT_741219 [Cadophora sp. MPI-SDFR-AT-0126]|nr:hypothetical protein BKA64DRAFT_741219 [Leotiomycetes sp. MPI-SDFR-AT-0126]